MVDYLIMPYPFAGTCIQGKNTVSIQIASDSVGSIIVVCRRSQRIVRNSPLYVNGDLSPGIYSTYVSIGILRPSIISIFPGMWNSVKLPNHFACNYIKGT